MLSSMVSGRWEKKSLTRGEDGKVFMDFDPVGFEKIVNVLRDLRVNPDRCVRIPDDYVTDLWRHRLSLPGVVPPFPGSEILHGSEDLKDALVAMLTGSDDDKMGEEMELLYQCTNDDVSPELFHESCNGKGATITIVRSTNGYIFGGYNPVSWSSSDERGIGVYSTAPDAFLFSLTNPAGTKPTKYCVEEGGVEAVCSSRYRLPCFGVGHDLCVWNDCGSYTDFPRSYIDTTGRGRATFTEAYQFTIDRVEVWKV